MADQNLPDYQPRKFIDTGYVKDLSVQHRKQDICVLYLLQ